MLRILIYAACIGGVWLGAAQASIPRDAEIRDRIRERYESILLNRPRKGAALRSLYQLHVEALDTEPWLDDVEARAQANPRDARLALLAGLILQEHGNDDRARGYSERAAELDPADWYAPFCLGCDAGYAAYSSHRGNSRDRGEYAALESRGDHRAWHRSG